MNTRTLSLAALAGFALCGPALAQSRIPNEFESAGNSLNSLSSYFGGVSDYGTRPSATTIHSGSSLEVWINFQHDNFFRLAGATFGHLAVPRASMGFAGNADTFSITVRSPQNGQLAMKVSLRDDDDGDGACSTDNDDAWDAPDVMLLPGTNVYNIPLSTFDLSNPGSGNGVMNFSTTGTMAMLVTFETRTTYPGGIVEVPVSILVDHMGLYAGNQSIPTPSCPADLDNGNGAGTPDGGVTIDDLLYFLNQFALGALPADLDNGNGTGTPDGGVTIDDLLFFLAHYEAGC